MKIGIFAYRQEPYISANTDIAYIIGEQIAKQHEVIFIGRKQDATQNRIKTHNGLKIVHLNEKPVTSYTRISNILQKYGIFSLAFRSDIISLRRICKKEHIEALICMTAPNEDAIITQEAKLGIPIYLYQLDPFYDFYGRTNQMYKEYFIGMLKSFNHVFTTDLLMKEYLSDDSIAPYRQKITSLNYPKLVYRTIGFKEQSDSPSLLYAGSLYRNIRNPEIMINLRHVLPLNYRIVFCGTCDNENDFERLKMNGIVCMGYCNKETLATEVDRADYLINIGNNISNQMASKVVDYIGTCKPILNIIQRADCPSVAVLKKYGNHIDILSNELGDRKNELISFLHRYYGVYELWDNVYRHYYEFTPEYVAKCVLSKVVQKV